MQPNKETVSSVHQQPDTKAASPDSSLLSRICLWRLQHTTAYDILLALLLGALIEYLFIPYVLHNTKYVRHLGDRIADSMIRLAEKVAGVPGSAVPFVFIDIDNATWRSWQAPLVTPRDRVARLLAAVAHSKPRVIVLDINLSWADPDPSRQNTLTQFLRDYPASGPALILLRSGISPDRDESRYPFERPTPFDDIIARRLAEDPAPLIRWATAYFDVDSDSIIRRWRIAETFCNKVPGRDGPRSPVVLPSVYLLAAAIAVRPKHAKGVVEEVDSALQELVPSSCNAGPQPPVHIHGMPHPVIAGAAEPGNRIIYSIAWDEDRPALGPFALIGSERVPLVSVRPARLIVSAGSSSGIDGLENRIAIIGGSYADSGDLHRTPLGIMPGALLIANATHALMVNGTPEEPGALWRFTLSFGLVLINALLFHAFRVELATAAAFLLLLLLMMATIPLFASGIVMDWEIPSLGILIHRYLGFLERNFRNARHRGWRSLVRSHQDFRGDT
jgi:CHASE2 domain-containing sensor protein